MSEPELNKAAWPSWWGVVAIIVAFGIFVMAVFLAVASNTLTFEPSDLSSSVSHAPGP